MKTQLKIFTAILFMTFQSYAFAQSEAEMKAWTEYMTPGPQHEMLSKSNGDWTADITMWMAPGSSPMTSEGNCSNKMILGGRYQYSTHTGNIMGMPFEGVSIIGYDNANKKFVSSWVDNMGTGIMNLTGTWDEATNSVTMTGPMTDPMTGKDCQIREVFKIVDDNNQTMEMYDNKTGTEVKVMEIKYKRK